MDYAELQGTESKRKLRNENILPTVGFQHNLQIRGPVDALPTTQLVRSLKFFKSKFHKYFLYIDIMPTCARSSSIALCKQPENIYIGEIVKKPLRCLIIIFNSYTQPNTLPDLTTRLYIYIYSKSMKTERLYFRYFQH